MGAVGPGVVEEVVGMIDLIVGQMLERGHAVNDVGGNVIVGVRVGQGLGALEALL